MTVIFTKGTSDCIRFDRVAALRAALRAEGAAPAGIAMKSGDTAGSEVVPVFNGDDMFYTSSNVNGSDGITRVFANYNNRVV